MRPDIEQRLQDATSTHHAVGDLAGDTTPGPRSSGLLKHDNTGIRCTEMAHRQERRWWFTGALLIAAFTFGAADQYVGSFTSWQPYATDLSMMAAPWLALPFMVGMTLNTPRRAMLVGLSAVFVGLVGYVVMTAHSNATGQQYTDLVGGQTHWFVLAAVTAPPAALLGNHSRTAARGWPVVFLAVITAAEPLVRSFRNRPFQTTLISSTELVAATLLGIVGFGLEVRRTRIAGI
jgi:hypothetical protein